MNKTVKALVAIMLITAALFAVGCKKERKAEVETSAVTNISSSSATAGGVITYDGNSSVVERGVCWSKASNPSVSDSHLSSGTGVGSFTVVITGLEAATTYYVRAYAINNAGISYGSSASFPTLTGSGGGGNGGGGNGGGGNGGGGDVDPADLPVVTTREVTNITGSSAKGGGDVVSNGAADVIDRGICWGTAHNPTISNNHVSCGTGTGSFTGEITGLQAESTYYVRAYATNAMGTAYGNEVSFVATDPSGAPVGAINGIFNAGPRFVYFSKGNLQYQPSTNTWRFAEHQYDRTDGNQYASSYYNGWLDIFAWGTSGFNHGAVRYEPWSTSESAEEYFAYGDGSYNLFDQTGQADWGYNAISNGGNTTNIWNTLTKEEWDYIINARYTPSNIRYARARVNGVDGLILVPDNWETSIYTLNQTNSVMSSYDSNIISASNWVILETAGAVFLPCTSVGNNSGNAYGYGHYWSSTAFYQTYYVPGAYQLSFIYNSSYSANDAVNVVSATRNNRYAVRLVQTANR